MAAAWRPAVHREPHRRRRASTTPRSTASSAALAEHGLTLLGARLLRQQPPSRIPAEREAIHAPRARLRRRRGRPRRRPGRDLHRARPGRSVAENLREAERVFPPLVDYAGERGVRLMIENCVMEGWHPDGYPGNLAYSPELWEWMFDLGLWLNFDPSHLLWLGIDPVAALRPYVDKVAHAHAKDAETFPERRNRYRLLRPHLHPRGGPLGHGLVALPDPRARAGGLPAATSTRSTRAASTACSRSSTRTRSGAGPPRRSMPGCASPIAPSGRWWWSDGDATPLLEIRGLEKEYPGVRALQGVDFDVRAGEVHCVVGPNGAGKSTLIKCVSGAVEPTAGEVLLDGRAAGGRQPLRGHRPRHRDDLPGARSRRGPLGRPERLPRARAAPGTPARPGQDAKRHGRDPEAARPRGDLAARVRPRPAARRPPGGVDRPRAVAQGAAADHGRAVGDPRRRRDRDDVRCRPPADGRGRRRDLHLAPPRRDQASR